LVALHDRAGAIEVLPMASRVGRPAKRVIVRARKASRTPMKLHAPFLVHDGADHVQGQSDYTTQAVAVLRDGAALDWIDA
jgi:tRNA1(Val) A37 N6-methylase TrmN6